MDDPIVSHIHLFKGDSLINLLMLHLSQQSDHVLVVATSYGPTEFLLEVDISCSRTQVVLMTAILYGRTQFLGGGGGHFLMVYF